MTKAEKNSRARRRDYLKGPVRLRGRLIPDMTTDERLLQPIQEADWVLSDPWRVLLKQAECDEGCGALAEIGHAISVFGSARIGPESPEYDTAIEVARTIASSGYAVITGGGPGILEAAHKRASGGDGVSMGLGIERPFERGTNES